jgi:hypothetical protein
MLWLWCSASSLYYLPVLLRGQCLPSPCLSPTVRLDHVG